MTGYTLTRAGSRGAESGVRPVVAGGEGDRDATGGAVVATLQPGFWRERARAVVGDREWVFGEAGDLGGRLTLDPEGTTRVRAVRTSFWASRYDVDLEGLVVHVRSGRRNRVWTTDDGSQLATSGRIGFWSPVPTLAVPADVPRQHVVSLLWLDHVVARRNQAAAAAA